MRKYLLLIILIPLSIKSFSGITGLQTAADTLIKKRVVLVSGSNLAAYAGGISFLRYIWYRDHERVPFHFYNDSKGYLQVDKAGHLFSTYHIARISYNSYRWAGLNKTGSILLGSATGMLFLTPIEIFDGMYEGWGFSWSDIIANTSGMLFFASQQAIFDKQVATLKISYSGSIYPEYYSRLGTSFADKLMNDYNGHTIWVSTNIKSVIKKDFIPDWLNFAIGYGAEGLLGEFENPEYYKGKKLPEFARYRQYFFSLDIDLSEIKTRKPWLKSILKAANLIKVPFPAIEFSNEHGIKFRPLYF